jgi:hypothetical protein
MTNPWHSLDDAVIEAALDAHLCCELVRDHVILVGDSDETFAGRARTGLLERDRPNLASINPRDPFYGIIFRENYEQRSLSGILICPIQDKIKPRKVQ